MKKSRLIAFLIVAAMLLSWVILPESHTHVHATGNDTVVTVGSVEGKAGDTLQIPVEIENNPGVMAIRVRVYLDGAPVSDVEVVTNEEDGNPLGDMDFSGNYNASKGFCSLLWDGEEDFAGDGVVGYINLTINDDAAPGTYTLRCEPKYSDAFNTSYDEIVLELVNGTITVLCTQHTFGAYVSDNNATCEADGTETATCSACGATDTRTVADSALGHSFTNYVDNGNADCVADGTETAKCDRCDVTDTRTVADSALGHSFTNYVSDGNATCDADGTETAKCDRCAVTDTRTVAGTALGHSFTEYVSDNNATCETDGTETATCDRCDATDTRTEVGSKDDVDHSFPAEYTSDGNATCTADGTKSRVCTVCGEKETVTDVGSALGHSFTNYVSDGNATCEADGTETAKCDRCAVTDTRTAAGSALGHSYTVKTTEFPTTAADCCHKATYYFSCANCGKQGTETFESGEYDLTNHVGGTEVRGTVAATEEAEGYTGDTYCLGCGAMIAKGETIPALDHTHNLFVTEAKAASCEEAGNIEYWSCKKCGKLYADAAATREITLADTVVAAQGHTWSTWIIISGATCTETGESERICEACGLTETEVLEALGHQFGEHTSDGNATCEKDGTKSTMCERCYAIDTIPDPGTALGHDFITYVSDGNATCLTDGTETATCVRCDETDTRTAEGSALGHSYTAQTTEYPATAADCCHKATYYYSCANCGEKGTETFEAGEYDMTKHVGGTEVRGVVAPTEEKEGYTGDTYCLGCGTVIAEGETIPVLDHTHVLVKTDAKAPTCEADGNSEYWTCSKCGKLYADAEGVKEITAADTVAAALGHSYTNYVSDGNATCEADGTETAKCDRCDETDTRTAVGSALGHNWSDWTVTTAATCTEDGAEERTCGNCGKVETNVLEALGHDMSEYVSNDDATCEADGTETSKCSRCDESDTRTAVGSALGHNWSDWTVTTAATCTEDGAQERTCGNCGKVEVEVIPAAHTFEEYVSDGNATCAADGTETAKCAFCDVTDTRVVEGSALEHTFGEWTLVKEATCTEAGEEVRTCDACTDTESREIPALGHDYESVVTEPTEKDKGYTTHTCTRCGDSYVDSYVDPIPGDLDNQPQTGDNAQTALWISMMLVAMMGTSALVIRRKNWLA